MFYITLDVPVVCLGKRAGSCSPGCYPAPGSNALAYLCKKQVPGKPSHGPTCQFAESGTDISLGSSHLYKT